MLRLSHWIDLTRTYQIKITIVLYCFQRNGKSANNPKRGRENLSSGVGYVKGRYYHPKHLRYSAGTSLKIFVYFGYKMLYVKIDGGGEKRNIFL